MHDIEKGITMTKENQQIKYMPWRLLIVLFAWGSIASYFAAFEIDSRLRRHYTSADIVAGMTIGDIKDALEGTPAVKPIK